MRVNLRAQLGVKLPFIGLIFFTSLSILLSYLKFLPCRSTNFASFELLSKSCYSDIGVFWNLKGLSMDLWAYKPSNPIEYPVIIGIFISCMAWLTNQLDSTAVTFFDINSMFLSLFFIGTVFLLRKINQKSWIYLSVCPIVSLTLFMNWDMLALFFSLCSIYFFDKGKLKYSGFMLGLAISTKFFPIVLIFPATAILIRKKILKNNIFNFYLFALSSWVLVNLPVALFSFQGWTQFYRLSFSRKIGDGSIWEALELLGFNFSNINLYYSFSFIALIGVLIFYILRGKYELNLAQSAYWSLFAFLFLIKVYSPQYVIWVAGFALLAIRNRRQIYAFLTWQVTEVSFHYAIWQFYIFRGTNGLGGLPPEVYAYSLALRFLGLSLLFYTLYFMRADGTKSKGDFGVIH